MPLRHLLARMPSFHRSCSPMLLFLLTRFHYRHDDLLTLHLHTVKAIGRRNKMERDDAGETRRDGMGRMMNMINIKEVALAVVKHIAMS